jgi:integrase
MATLKTNHLKSGKTTYTVTWRAGGGRDGKWDHETFDDDKQARFFKADVERHGHRYPPNYVPHFGYVDPAVLADEKARLAAEAEAAAAIRPVLFEDRYLDFLNTLTSIEDRSALDYTRQFRNHLLPAFAGLVVNPAAEVPEDQFWDADKVKAWVNRARRGKKDPASGKWLVKPIAPKTIRNLHALLSSYGKWLVAKGVCTVNPCTGTRLPESDEGDADVEMTFLEHDEFAELRTYVKEAEALDLVDFLAGTGARYSEATALKVKDLFLGGREPYFLVRRAWKRQPNGSHLEGRPKSRASRRRVELSGNTPMLTLLRRLSVGRSGDDYVFVTPTGVYWRHANFYGRPWLQALYKAVRCYRHRAADGIGNMHKLRRRHVVPCGCPGTMRKAPRIHDLRHTNAAWLIEAGVSLYAIQQQFGHESYNTTEKRYGHLTSRTKSMIGEAITMAMQPDSLGAGVAATAWLLNRNSRPADRKRRRQRMLMGSADSLRGGIG